MNYFEFYDIPISFKVDKAALKKIYYKNSKQYHPDFYTLESAEKQQEILELSTKNNEAFEVLSDFNKRMKYILTLKNILSEEGKNPIPQDFLMEMMDINEAIMELEFGFEETTYLQAKQAAEQLDVQLYESVSSVIENYQDQEASQEDLNQIKDYYLKKRYLFRIFENLNKFASA